MIIVDTGFWLALVDQKDTYHEAAKQALKKYNEPLITTWSVITETCYLLLTRKGVKTRVSAFNFVSKKTDSCPQICKRESNLSIKYIK